MSTLSNNTLANPGNSFYALASESGKNWYQYPSLNGSVLLQDSSGIQVLQAVGGDLFFNQELLAKAGDIQDIAAWSDYPVLNPGGVNFNGNPLVNASTISTTGDISSNGDIHSRSLFVTGGIETGASGIFTSFLSTNGGVGVNGNVKTATVSATGLVSAGSVTASGAVQGGSLVTTGGLDMTNTAITRASSVGISNAGFAPYGSLTSPDGVQLTWNGAAITTGGAGNVSQWANFNAINTINAASNNITNVGSITATSATVTDASMGTMSLGRNQITGSSATPMIIKGDDTQSTQIMGGSITETSTTGNISITSYNNVNVNSGNDIIMLSDAGINPLVTPTVGMTAQNGNGGRIDLTAKAGYGVNPVQIGYGTINLKALGAANGLFNLGGKIDLTAYSGGLGDYGGFTSRVSASAATIALSAGAAPVLPGLAGSMNIFGQGAISIVCSLVPPVLPQFPQTIYMFANGIPGVAGGVRLESPNGIQMLSDTYINNLYPLDTGGLKIAGRSFLGTANVTIEDVASLTAVAGSGQVKTDLLNSVTGSGVSYLDNLVASSATKGIYANFLKPLGATAPGVPNLIISNNPFGGNNNYVDISGAGVISFDSTGTGALRGVQSINGASWPPATGDASLWSQYPQTSVLDGSGYGMINVGDMLGVVNINGQAYTPTSQWATFNAVSAVDLSSNGIVNVASINVLDNATIISAGSLGIFTDGKDLTLASDNSGNVNIGTGNKGDISITTSGAGNDLTLAGDTVNIDAALGVRIAAPYLDMTGNNINNVNQINGVGGTTELRIQNTGTGGTSILDLSGGILVASQYAPVTIDGGSRLNLQSTTGNITLDPLTGSGTVNVLGDTIIGTVPAPQTLTVNGTARATGDVISSFGGSTPYSLNTIGALVNGNQQYNYWVAVNGSDISGTGSVIRPFASITAALAAIVGITDTIPVNICLTAGTYTENPTMTRNNTFISGSVGIADCVIVGTFTFNSTSASTVSQGLTGVTVVGNVICSETTSSDTTWYIQNCNITSYGTTAIAATSTGAGNNSLVLYNTVVTQNVVANPCISIATVRLNAIQSQFNNTTTGSAVSCSGTGSMSLFGITLTCAGTATASAFIIFSNATGNGTASSFQLCTFTYTAATVGSGKTAVFFNNAGALAGLTLFNQNVFNMLGSSALIQRAGAGAVAIQWGTNSSNILTLPAAGSGLTYSYLTSTPLRANTLYDSASSAGTASQVLTAGSAGGSLAWSSLGATSLGALAATSAARANLNSIAMYDTSNNALTYDSQAYSVVVQAAPATVALSSTMRGRTYIVTSTGAQTLTFTSATLTAADTNFFILVKNGNPTGGGDITIGGATGNVTVHNKTATASGGVGYVVWNGTALIAY